MWRRRENILYWRIKKNVQGVLTKKGDYQMLQVWFTVHLIWSRDYSFLIHLKIKILQVQNHFFSNIREPRNILFFYLRTWHLPVKLLIIEQNQACSDCMRHLLCLCDACYVTITCTFILTQIHLIAKPKKIMRFQRDKKNTNVLFSHSN